VINDILDISKVESGKMELKSVPFQTQDIFNDVKNLFSLEADEKGINLILPEPDDHTVFLGDPMRIGQIIINLVGNALKFTSEGQVVVTLETSPGPAGGICFKFTVTDTGMGIDESSLEEIFESFTQGDAASTVDGTGLGLAICRRLVEMMQGSIYATSTKGKGSSFFFSVMVEEWNERDNSPMSEIPDLEKTIRVTGQENQSLLLVEDNTINQELAREVLTSAGYEVTVANNGQEALDQLESNQFGAILMDLRMPVMDGFETLKRIRANPLIRHLPVVALSAGVLQNEVEKALQMGFDEYISKPIDFNKLLSLLNQISRRVPECDTDTEKGELVQQEILGVDFGSALKMHDHDEDLLLSLMDEFVRIYSDADKDFLNFLKEKELEKAERLMHNMAGVVGNFGANQLMKVSRLLEHEFIHGKVPEPRDVQDFSRELGNFVKAIGQYQAAS